LSEPGGAGWTDIGSSNSETYNYGTLTTTTKFVRRAVEGTCTTPVYSNEVTVTVRPQLNGGTIGSDQTICYGADAAAFTSSAAASGGAGVFIYTWQYTTNMAAVPGGAGWTDIGSSNSLTYDYGIQQQRAVGQESLSIHGSIQQIWLQYLAVPDGQI